LRDAEEDPFAYGETVAEATRNAREVIELHLENLVAHR
jgi:predicted RNase H-like HicB family nuclease